MKPWSVAILVGAVAVGAAIALALALSDKTSAPAPPGAETPGGARQSRPSGPFRSPRAAFPKVLKLPRAPEYTEAALMVKLRELGGSNPELSLRLAREGNAKFKDSPDAAERAWIVVKSLVNMNRSEEARTEGAALIQKYPGTSWANDIHRHLFVNHPPTERGFGKKTEPEEGPK